MVDPRGVESMKYLVLTSSPLDWSERLETLYDASLPFVDVQIVLTEA
jgi:hypothetical protein